MMPACLLASIGAQVMATCLQVRLSASHNNDADSNQDSSILASVSLERCESHLILHQIRGHVSVAIIPVQSGQRQLDEYLHDG